MSKDDLLSRALCLEDAINKEYVYIVNYGYGAYLKLGNDWDESRDRIAYVHEGGPEANDRSLWSIRINGIGKLSIYNDSQSNGFLFRQKKEDGDGDFRIWGHFDEDIEDYFGEKDFRDCFKIVPMDEGGKIYKIYTGNLFENRELLEPLKAAKSRDRFGDHEVYSQPGENDGDRFQWILLPID